MNLLSFVLKLFGPITLVSSVGLSLASMFVFGGWHQLHLVWLALLCIGFYDLLFCNGARGWGLPVAAVAFCSGVIITIALWLYQTQLTLLALWVPAVIILALLHILKEHLKLRV